METHSPLFWLSLNLLSLIFLSFYSMMEMACVSFNKLRLQYYTQANNKRAKRLSEMLADSSKLFGTTLIGVNVATMFGSEFARNFHSSLGLSPDLAPFSQVAIVIVFGELAPMFAARRFAEHVALLGSFTLWISSKIMTPFLIMIKGITQTIHLISGQAPSNTPFFLTQEELQTLLERKDDRTENREQFDEIVQNIFALKTKTAEMVMTPLHLVTAIPATSTVATFQQKLQFSKKNFLIAYHKKVNHVVGIATPRDFLFHKSTSSIQDKIRPAWFITKETDILTILKQFRQNSQNVAIVLNKKGQATGILTLEDVLGEIFGKISFSHTGKHLLPVIDKTIAADMRIDEFNAFFEVDIPTEGVDTFEELLKKVLGHQPHAQEFITLPPYEITAKECTLLEVITVHIRTL